uniref:F-box domain-containing protein n=1 Tax=Kalanchoe fedtschenkoi TaxID=63787 RepID=A0A7N0TQI1_KALFE
MPQPPMLATDVIPDILSLLPVKTLVRFRCVCRQWNSLIRDPMFIELHLNRTMSDIEETRRWRFLLPEAHTCPLRSFRSLNCKNPDSVDDQDFILSVDYPRHKRTYDDRHVRVVGSCNGLVCLLHKLNHYILWNPSTGEFRDDLATIVLPPGVTNPISSCFSHGFGYDSTMDDYKIVRITNFIYPSTKVHVLNLGSNSWRVFELKDPILPYHDSMFVSGSLHWLSGKTTDVHTERGILAFSLAEEKFREETLLPTFMTMEASRCVTELRVVGEKLSALAVHSKGQGTCDIEIWVMLEYGVKGSWRKKVTLLFFDLNFVSWGYLFDPLYFLRNGETLVMLNEDIMIYDPEENSYRKVYSCYRFGGQTASLYIETLVSPFRVPSAIKTIKRK